MDERQRAAWRALALGPVWQRRPDLPVSASTTGLIGVVANDARPGQIASAPVPAPAPAPALPTWAGLRQAVEACAGCQRAVSRTVAVFGSGSDQAAWMVVGHQPDSDDDAAGEPYSGAAGQLLERMLEAIGVSRARDVFITQSVKCRAPDDRSPQTGELAACSGHLRHQIGLLRPALILADEPTANLDAESAAAILEIFAAFNQVGNATRSLVPGR